MLLSDFLKVRKDVLFTFKVHPLVTSMFSEYFKTFLVQTQDQHSILEFSSLAVLACKSLFLSLKLAQELHFFEICFTKNFQT
jgi:hypothetical protein